MIKVPAVEKELKTLEMSDVTDTRGERDWERKSQ